MATGDLIAFWLAAAHEPASGLAPFQSNANNHPYLAFDGDDACVFSGVVPPHYGGGGYDVIIHWWSSSTAGDVDWDGQFERIGVGQQDVDADGYAAIQSADNNSEPATSGWVAKTTISFTEAQADSLVAGEGFRLQILRDDTSDTSSGQARIRWVEVIEG